MNKEFEELIEITGTIKKIVNTIKDLEENNQLGTEEYDKIAFALKTAIFIEDKLYCNMDIDQIEKYINKTRNMANENLTDISFVIDEYNNYDDIPIIYRRIFDHLIQEITKKMDYLEEDYEEYDPECDIDKSTGSFKLGDRKIYVFDRKNEFYNVKLLSKVSMNIEFLNELRGENKIYKRCYKDFANIKYDLIFANNMLTEKFLANRFLLDDVLLEKEDGFSLPDNNKELFLYFKDYYGSNLFDDILDWLMGYNDEDFKCENAKENKMEFILDCFCLKACINEVDNKDDLLGSLILLENSTEKNQFVYSKLEQIINSSCKINNNKIKVKE